jgi:hypothetical protein
VSREHLDYYLDEFTFRFKTRTASVPIAARTAHDTCASV